MQRTHGKTDHTFYRVRLTDGTGTYYSEAVNAVGSLDRRSWRIAREIVRQRRVAYRFGPGGQRGYLLKRRLTGQPCPDCLDVQTGESKDPNCPGCLGLGFSCGYYYPQACVWAELSPETRHTELDGGQSRGTVSDVTVEAEMLAVESLEEEDVWVSALRDERYFAHKITDIAEYRGVPLIAHVELRPIPFSSPIYGIQIPQQLLESSDRAPAFI